jgi:hypothetical protein
LFGVNNISTSQTKAFIGCSDSDKVLYQDKLHNLDKFQMIFKDPTENKIRTMEADKFWESYR